MTESEKSEIYRVDKNEPRIVLCGDQCIGLMISEEIAAQVVRALNGARPGAEAPVLIVGEEDRFVWTGPNEYVLDRQSKYANPLTYTRAEIDSYGPDETVEVWS